MYRKSYEDPEMEVVLFDTLDIVTTSDCFGLDEGDNECPFDEGEGRG